MRRRPLLGVSILSLLATAIGIAIVLSIDWFPTEASTASKKIDHLYDVLLVASVPVFVLVMAVAIYSVVAFRAKPGDLSDGEPIHGNTRLEIVWVTIPLIMVSALAVYGWVVLDDIEAKASDPLVVNANAQQFAWSFDYPREGKVKSNELMLPKDRPVEFRLHTNDVIHSFWVPQFRLKQDIVPGITTKIRVTPDRVGRYDVVCAELCGLGHATMRQRVRVMPAGQFDAWLAKKKQGAGGGGQGAAGAGGDSAGAGKQLFADSGCDACHTLSDAGSTAKVGPNLDTLPADAAKYGKKRGQSPEEYVRASIRAPNEFVVPGFGKGIMPETYRDQLSTKDIDALVKYLLSVRGGQTK